MTTARRPSRAGRPSRAVAALVAGLALLAAACGSDGSTSDEATPSADDPIQVTLVTHDSFDVSESVLEAFTTESGIEVRLLAGGDAGAMVNQAILTKGAPQADVLFGIDNGLLSRAFDAELFEPYASPGLDRVPADLQLDPEHRVTPIDTGDVCINYDKAALAEAGTAPPATLDDLADPAFQDALVVQNPATSSPGLAFLLATIDAFGPDGWQDYWERLVDNGVEVAAGWEDAYYGRFSGAGGGDGDRPLVVSYASSPPAEVIFAEEPLTEAPTGVMVASCYRQIEFAGILTGTEQPDAARALIDFLLSDAFQADIPGTMFVYPAVEGTPLPEEFVAHGATPQDPYLLAPDVVAEHRDEWIEEWTDIVLR